jgi:tetratricopeptide (TPR) repeat protein
LDKKKFFLLTMALVGAMAFSQGCVINKLRAKASLNDGAREFNKGRYEAAQEKFEFAMKLSPDLANAQLFYARALNSRFDQELTEDLGLKAIEAYETIIRSNQSDHDAVDKALAFQSSVYDSLSRVSPDKSELYKEKSRETILKRGELPGATANTKAIVYHKLGADYWHECYHEVSAPYIARRQPIPPEAQEKMKALIRKAHEYLNKAISVDPQYADAYFYEKLVLLEELKLETNPAKQNELKAQVKKLEDLYLQLQKQKQQQSS